MTGITYLDTSKPVIKLALPDGGSLVLFSTRLDKYGKRLGPTKLQNIFRLSGAGEVVWQIEAPQSGPKEEDRFVDLNCDDAGRVLAGAWTGDQYEIDVETGKIRAIGWTR